MWWCLKSVGYMFQTQWWINNLKKKERLSKVIEVELVKDPLTVKLVFLSMTRVWGVDE